MSVSKNGVSIPRAGGYFKHSQEWLKTTAVHRLARCRSLWKKSNFKMRRNGVSLESIKYIDMYGYKDLPASVYEELLAIEVRLAEQEESDLKNDYELERPLPSWAQEYLKDEEVKKYYETRR